jgi:hypothetical protein
LHVAAGPLSFILGLAETPSWNMMGISEPLNLEEDINECRKIR